MQKVDALLDLRLDDPKVDRDARILDSIRNSARLLIRNPRARAAGVSRASLYYRYRGTGFPIQNKAGLRIPSWRSLTPWMKVQLATLALAERGYMQFKLHLHDDLLVELKAAGRDPKTVLRDNIARHLKRRFDVAPWFFFVMEELTKDGQQTRPHAHGSISIPRIPLPTQGPGARRLRAIEQKDGLAQAEMEAGRAAVVEALKAGCGGARPLFGHST